MRHLILDHYRRRWFLWSFFCLFYFVMGLLTANMGEPLPLFSYLILAFSLQTYLLQEVQQGYLRIVLGLPLTTQQVGRTLWFISVGFASLFVACFSLLGMVFLWLCGSSAHFNFEAWMLSFLSCAFTYGAIFGLYSVWRPRSSASSDNWLKNAANSFYSIAMPFLFLGAALCFMRGGYPTALSLSVFFFVSGILSFLGWFRVERAIVDYSEYRQTLPQPNFLRRKFKVSNGFGGIPFIFGTTFFRVWSMALYFLIGMTLTSLFIDRQFDWHSLVKYFCHGGGFFMLCYFTLFFSFRSSLIQYMRFLRTMPISTRRLAAVLLSADILPALVLFLTISFFAWMETNGAFYFSVLKTGLLAIVPISVCITVWIWNTRANFMNVIILATFILASIAPAVYQLIYIDDGGLPLWFIILFDVGMVGLCYYAICDILTRSSSAYLVRKNKFGNRLGGDSWNWGR